MSEQQSASIAFIHGAGLGRWIWDEVTPHLHAPYVVTDFPLREKPKEARANLSFDDYVSAVTEQIETSKSDKVVIVAHSIGGVVALAVADRLSKRLAGFVAIGAAIPSEGGSFLSVLPPPKRIIMGALMRFVGTRPPPSAIKAGLCSDLTAEKTQQVIERFAPESLRLYTQRTNTKQIPLVPSLYIRLTEDKEFPPALQTKMASNLPSAEVVDIKSGHMPMLSQPQALTAILNNFVERALS